MAGFQVGLTPGINPASSGSVGQHAMELFRHSDFENSSFLRGFVLRHCFGFRHSGFLMPRFCENAEIRIPEGMTRPEIRMPKVVEKSREPPTKQTSSDQQDHSLLVRLPDPMILPPATLCNKHQISYPPQTKS
jgi:hypothetical protein